MNLLQLVMGDYGGDGHSQTRTSLIKTNLNNYEIKEAYYNGVKLIGVDLINAIASEYEERDVLPEYREAYLSAGYSEEDYSLLERLDYNSFCTLYLFTVQKGNPEFKYEHVNVRNIYIGGYGLFS